MKFTSIFFTASASIFKIYLKDKEKNKIGYTKGGIFCIA